MPRRIITLIESLGIFIHYKVMPYMHKLDALTASVDTVEYFPNVGL